MRDRGYPVLLSKTLGTLCANGHVAPAIHVRPDLKKPQTNGWPSKRPSWLYIDQIQKKHENHIDYSKQPLYVRKIRIQTQKFLTNFQTLNIDY